MSRFGALFEAARSLVASLPRRHTADLALTGAVSPHGRLVAQKIPAPERSRSLSAGDSAIAGERAVIEGSAASGQAPSAFRVADSQVPHASAADLDEGDRIRYRVDGRAEHGERGVLLAASHVMERLNERGASWREVRVSGTDAREERGVDVVLLDAAGRSLGLQVTRPEHALWSELASTGVATGSRSVAEAAEALWQAVEGKRTRADPSVVLVLDAVNAPHFAFTEVISSFRATRAADAARAGFSEVWLAGPTSETTFRLDGASDD